MGCWADDESNRVLQRRMETSTDMTVLRCVLLCGESYFEHAGITMGTECWCGGSAWGQYREYLRLGSTNRCTFKCADGKYCGGHSALNVYLAVRPVRPTPAPAPAPDSWYMSDGDAE